jgi:hypothetical protein
MRRWIIAGATLVLAAAVSVTIWLATRSDRPATYSAPGNAVKAVCHAAEDPRSAEHVGFLGRSKEIWAITVPWRDTSGHRWTASVSRREGTNEYRVTDCKVRGWWHFPH